MRNHVQVLLKRVTKEQEKKMADILKNEQVEWIKKIRHVEQERDRATQERDKELSLMRERMSQGND